MAHEPNPGETIPDDARERVEALRAFLLPEMGKIWRGFKGDERAEPCSPQYLPYIDKADAVLAEHFDSGFLALAPMEAFAWREHLRLADTWRTQKERRKHQLLVPICYGVGLKRFSASSVGRLESLLGHPLCSSWWVEMFLDGLSGAIALRSKETASLLPQNLGLVLPILRRLVRGEIAAGPKAVDSALAVLDANGELDYPTYRAAALTIGGARHSGWPTFPSSGTMTDYEPAPAEVQPDDSPTPIVAHKPVHRRNLDLFARQLAAEFLPDLDGDKLMVMANFRRFSGGEVLVHLAGAIERMGIDSLKDGTTSGGRIGKIADLVETLEPEDPAPIVEKLRGFKRSTLKLLRPYSGAGEPLLIAALGLEDSPQQKLYQLLMEQILANSAMLEGDWHSPFCNDANPLNGVLDPQAIRVAAEGVSDKGRKEAIAMLDLPGDRSPANAKLLFSAIFGDNEKKIRDSLKRNSQPAAKALGLLPLPEDDREPEIDARYLALLDFEKRCQKFGPERRANSAAAVRVGMSNLAANAGYADAERLAWAVEARLAGGAGGEAGAPRRVEVGAYTAVLGTGESGAPTLFVEKGGKALKSVPAPVRKTAEFKALRESADHLKKQYSRLRRKLEQMLATGEALSRADLDSMARLPALRHFLPRLILRGEAGGYGVFEPDSASFTGVGEEVPTLSEPFSLAHPSHLLEDGRLSLWQREMVRRRAVQPFKQAFRELYVLTEAERAAGDASRRFAGRELDARVAGRLLGSRGWLTARHGEVHIHRPFRDAGLEAVLELQEYPHFLSEMGSITTAAVVFHQLGAADRLPLEAVPPILFSEAMRDIDLAASVAYLGEGGWVSSDVQVRRRELLDAIVADFALSGVAVDGNHAKVEGQRARYRVHLGTGAIYIEPGQHLCVVPDRSKALPTDIYLPFAADDDPKLCEIVSRILLLINDAKIRDKVILDQIDRALGETGG